MEKTHWLSSPNKNYLGHWDLPENEELTLTIKSAAFEEIKNPTNGQKDVKKVIRWVEKGYKPMIVNQTNSKAIYKSTGVKYLEDSEGKKITLFISQVMNRKEGEMVDCIRVRPYPIKEQKATKQPISKQRFDNALKAIEKGTYTVKDLKAQFQLTAEQEKQLP
jgi:hypothetical protein